MDYSRYLMKLKLPRVIESFVGKRKRLYLGLGSSKGIEEIKDSLVGFVSQVTSAESCFIHKVLKCLKPIVPVHRDGLIIFYMGDEDNVEEDFVMLKPLAQMPSEFLFISYDFTINLKIKQYMVSAEDKFKIILVDEERIVTFSLQDSSCSQIDDIDYQQGGSRVSQKSLVSSLHVFHQLDSNGCRGLILGLRSGCEWLEECLPEGITPIRKQIIREIGATTWEQLMNADMNSLQISREICLLRDFYEVRQTKPRFVTLGMDDTMDALERDSVDTLILWDRINLQRCVMIDQDNEELVSFLPEEQATPLRHPTSQRELVTVERTNMAD